MRQSRNDAAGKTSTAVRSDLPPCSTHLIRPPPDHLKIQPGSLYYAWLQADFREEISLRLRQACSALRAGSQRTGEEQPEKSVICGKAVLKIDSNDRSPRSERRQPLKPRLTQIPSSSGDRPLVQARTITLGRRQRGCHSRRRGQHLWSGLRVSQLPRSRPLSTAISLRKTSV